MNTKEFFSQAVEVQLGFGNPSPRARVRVRGGEWQHRNASVQLIQFGELPAAVLQSYRTTVGLLARAKNVLYLVMHPTSFSPTTSEHMRMFERAARELANNQALSLERITCPGFSPHEMVDWLRFSASSKRETRTRWSIVGIHQVLKNNESTAMDIRRALLMLADAGYHRMSADFARRVNAIADRVECPSHEGMSAYVNRCLRRWQAGDFRTLDMLHLTKDMSSPPNPETSKPLLLVADMRGENIENIRLMIRAMHEWFAWSTRSFEAAAKLRSKVVQLIRDLEHREKKD